MRKSQSGSVLVVMMGISLIIIGLILTLTLRVRQSLSDVPIIAKHAQAYLMLQGALMYLNEWPSTHVTPPKNPPEKLNAAGTTTDDPTKRLGFYVLGSYPYPYANLTPPATPTPPAHPTPSVASWGWYFIAYESTTSTTKKYFIVTAGGGSHGRTMPVKDANGKKSLTDQWPYEICYYFTYDPSTNPSSAVLTGPTWPTNTGTPTWPNSSTPGWPGTIALSNNTDDYGHSEQGIFRRLWP